MKYAICLIITCLSFVFQICAQRMDTLKPGSNLNVGDLIFDSRWDDPSFRLCNPQTVPQYYHVGGGYNGGRKQILALLKKKGQLHMKTKDKDGYITIRFIVNCQGETGRFRVLEVNQQYKPVRYDSTSVQSLLSFTKGLKDWRPGIVKGQTYDYYQYLTFKIENGKVVDVLP